MMGASVMSSSNEIILYTVAQVLGWEGYIRAVKLACERPERTTGSVRGYSLCRLSAVQARLPPASIGRVGAPQRPQKVWPCSGVSAMSVCPKQRTD